MSHLQQSTALTCDMYATRRLEHEVLSALHHGVRRREGEDEGAPRAARLQGRAARGVQSDPRRRPRRGGDPARGVRARAGGGGGGAEGGGGAAAGAPPGVHRQAAHGQGRADAEVPAAVQRDHHLRDQNGSAEARPGQAVWGGAEEAEGDVGGVRAGQAGG
eukprot:824090-Pyramimonas_sp.AAC.1